jgi:hypothetical protein
MTHIDVGQASTAAYWILRSYEMAITAQALLGKADPSVRLENLESAFRKAARELGFKIEPLIPYVAPSSELVDLINATQEAGYLRAGEAEAALSRVGVRMVSPDDRPGNLPGCPFTDEPPSLR